MIWLENNGRTGGHSGGGRCTKPEGGRRENGWVKRLVRRSGATVGGPYPRTTPGNLPPCTEEPPEANAEASPRPTGDWAPSAATILDISQPLV